MRADLFCCVWFPDLSTALGIIWREHSGAVAVDDGGRTFCCYTEPENSKNIL